MRYIKVTLKIDDSLDVFPVHGVGGFTGLLLTAVFSSPSFDGLGLPAGVSIGGQLLIQLIGAAWRRRRLMAVPLAIMPVLAIVAVNFPATVSRNFYGRNLQRPEAVPAYWTEAIAALEDQGYKVQKGKLKKACGEFYTIDKTGAHTEVFVDPTNGTIRFTLTATEPMDATTCTNADFTVAGGTVASVSCVGSVCTITVTPAKPSTPAHMVCARIRSPSISAARNSAKRGAMKLSPIASASGSPSANRS